MKIYHSVWYRQPSSNIYSIPYGLSHCHVTKCRWVYSHLLFLLDKGDYYKQRCRISFATPRLMHCGTIPVSHLVKIAFTCRILFGNRYYYMLVWAHKILRGQSFSLSEKTYNPLDIVFRLAMKPAPFYWMAAVAGPKWSVRIFSCQS